MRISDWSSDVCSSDLNDDGDGAHFAGALRLGGLETRQDEREEGRRQHDAGGEAQQHVLRLLGDVAQQKGRQRAQGGGEAGRSEEHTSELQSLMRISYAVICLKQKNTKMRT